MRSNYYKETKKDWQKMICRQFNDSLNGIIMSMLLNIIGKYDKEKMLDAVDEGEKLIERYFQYSCDRFNEEFRCDLEYHEVNIEPFNNLVEMSLKDHWKLTESTITDAVVECTYRNAAAILIGILNILSFGKKKGNSLLNEACNTYESHRSDLKSVFYEKCRNNNLRPERFTCDREDINEERRKRSIERNISQKQAKFLQDQLLAMRDYIGGVKA